MDNFLLYILKNMFDRQIQSFNNYETMMLNSNNEHERPKYLDFADQKEKTL